MFLDEYSVLQETIKARALNEDYFGKKDSIKEMEEVIKKMKDHKGNLNDSDLKIELEKLIAKEFNFKSADIKFINTSNYLNAATYPARSYYSNPIKFITGSVKNSIKVKKDGVEFKDRVYNFRSIIGSPLIYNLEPAQTLGIILHEIGHNFQIVDNGIIGRLFGLLFLIPLFMSKIISKLLSPLEGLFDKLNYSLEKENMKDKKFISQYFSGQAFLKYYQLLFSIIPISVTTLTNLTNAIIKRLIHPESSKGNGYENEIASDSFANMFGYGAEAIKGLEEFKALTSAGEATDIEEFKKFLKNSEWASKFISFDTQLMTILLLTEEHPSNVQRANKQIRFAEYELKNNDNLSKKDKKELENQIKLLKTVSEDSFREYLQNEDAKERLEKMDKFKEWLLNPSKNDENYNDLKEYLDKQ
jgi:hypothetical protein